MDPTVKYCLIFKRDAALGGLRALAGTESLNRAIEQVAAEIVRDPRWASRSDIAFVIAKTGSGTSFAAFGAFNENDLSRLRSLADQLARAGRKSRYVDYRQAEADCEILASRLKAQYGHQELKRFSWHAIPRGGAIILGILSYVLDLPASSLAPNGPSDAPAVVVDDCALTGQRFSRTLKQMPGKNVVFTPIYSHPDLREAIRKRETRVLDCLGAHDLVDLAPGREPDVYAEWKARWKSRLGQEVYWVGQPEYLCFAWNEPETSCWNTATEKIEPGWRLVPRSRCLRSRFEIRQAENDAEAPRLQIQPAPAGPLKPGDQVLYARMSEGRIAAALPGSDCFLMEDVAADMWMALVEHGALKPAAASLAGKYEVERERLEADMKGFVEHLEQQGLFVRDDS